MTYDNNTRLYLVEGIPGSGKTTTAKRIYDDLTKSGKRAKVYFEGDQQPADVSWQAVMTETEYETYKTHIIEIWEKTNKAISKDELIALIDDKACEYDGNIYLAYAKIEYPEDIYWSIVDEAASHELCDGRAPLEKFTDVHLKRWARFAKETTDDATIFECAFLQNHIFELMGVYQKDDEFIMNYLMNLINTVRSLNPMIIYIKPDSIKNVIDNAAAARKSHIEGRPDWIDEIAKWVENSNFGKARNLNGKQGVYEFCRERTRLDEMAIKRLGVPVQIIERKTI